MKSKSYMHQGYEYLSVIANYFKQVYTGYGYIYKASTEIAWEQIGLDSAQDGALDSGFEHFIQFGHSANEIVLKKCCGGGFFYHLKSHLEQKTAAVIAFPWIAPILSSTYSSNIPWYIEDPIRMISEFSGINPLEGLYSLSTAPKIILGDNNVISSTAEYFTFHDIFNVEKAKDHKFNQYIKLFKSYMEFCDSIGHTIREATILYINLHLASMPYKAAIYLIIKSALYYNTKIEEASNDKRIEELSLQLQQSLINEANIDEDNSICLSNEASSWNGHIYNKWSIAALVGISSITYAKLYSTVINIDWRSYFPKHNNPSDPTDDTKLDHHQCNHKKCDHFDGSSILWGDLHKQGLGWILPSRKADYKVLQEVAATARPTTPTLMAKAVSCPDFKGKITAIATPSPSKKMIRSSSTHGDEKEAKALLFDFKILETDTSSDMIRPMATRGNVIETSKSVLGDDNNNIGNLIPPSTSREELLEDNEQPEETTTMVFCGSFAEVGKNLIYTAMTGCTNPDCQEC